MKANNKTILEYIKRVIAEETISEGGNTFALDRATGKPKRFADKIDLAKINRQSFTKEFVAMFDKLNKVFQSKYGKPIWTDSNLVRSGEVLTGSAKFLFDKNISDDEFIRHKPKVGDIDIAIPHDYLSPLFDLLLPLEGKKITSKVRYIGNNKRVVGQNHQINCIFEFSDDSGNIVNAQVDFEGAKFEDDKPSAWSQFSHSSNWNDIKSSIKGVAHKYLLKAIARNINKRDDIVILTKGSPLEPSEKVRVKTSHGKLLEPQGLAFSVDRGIRGRYAQQFVNGKPLIINGKFAFKDADTNESGYITNPVSMFEIMFKTKPNSSDMSKFNSFIGLIELMEKHLDKTQIVDSFNSLVKGDLWGPGAQELERVSAEIDKEVKGTMAGKMVERFPYLKQTLIKFQPSIEKYYSNYGKRNRLAN
jgi:hypothetical protein